MRIEGHRGRLTAEHFLLMAMPRRFWEVSFDQIEPHLQGVLRKYLQDLDGMLNRGQGLLFWGDNGRGKTSAACFVMKEVRRTGASALMVTAASLIDSVLEKTEVDDGLLIDRARTVDFLLIDDLTKESKSDFAERIMENLFRERGGAKRTTFITAQSGPEKLALRYSKSVLEVLKEQVLPVHVEGDNRRDEARDELAKRVG